MHFQLRIFHIQFIIPYSLGGIYKKYVYGLKKTMHHFFPAKPPKYEPS